MSPSGTGSSLSNPVVETAAGKLVGQAFAPAGLAHAPVAIFKGIPYGASTSGAGRFMPPRKPEPWAGIRDALELGLRAPQTAMKLPPENPLAQIMAVNDPMGEDCLCLNVWSPGLGSARKRPVMVWLHGGGFSFGSGGQPAYAGTELAARRDVVVVTVNHRLNVFGYLYLADFSDRYPDSANVGMLDLVAALEWVRGNIAEFGGDPSNVTLFGQSGGGWKASVLMAMPAARGLFHRVIVQSGPMLKALPRDRAAGIAAAFLAKLGLTKDRADQLQKLPMEQLLEALPTDPGSQLGIAPVADGRAFPGHPFDPEAPAISAGIPLLIGSNATEMTVFGPPPDEMDDATFLARAKQWTKIGDTAAKPLITAYKEAHGSNVEACLALDSDWLMRIKSIIQAERQSALGAAAVYMYYFTWRTPVRNGRLRSPHGLEIPFVFDHPDVWPGLTGAGADRYALADKMSGAWAEFARSGKPGNPDLPDWPAYTTDRRATMILDNECHVAHDPGGSERLAFLASGAGASW